MNIIVLLGVLLIFCQHMVWAGNELVVNRCIRQVDPFLAERILRCDKGQKTACLGLAKDGLVSKSPCSFDLVKGILDSNCSRSKDEAICSVATLYQKHDPRVVVGFLIDEGFVELYSAYFAKFMNGMENIMLTTNDPLLGGGCKKQLTEQLFLGKAALRRYHEQDLQCYIKLLDEFQCNRYLK